MKKLKTTILGLLIVAGLVSGCNEDQDPVGTTGKELIANLEFANNDEVYGSATYWLCSTDDPDRPPAYIPGGNYFHLVIANDGTGYRHNWSFTWTEGEEGALDYVSPRAKGGPVVGTFTQFQGSIESESLQFVDERDGISIDISCVLGEY